MNQAEEQPSGQATDVCQQLPGLIGADYVSLAREVCARYEQATFSTSHHVHAVAFPESKGQLQLLVRWASDQRIPLYPISAGKNYGLGSRAPTADGVVIVDLSRLNRIVGYDEQLGAIAVEPGVTFAAVFAFLQAKGSRHYMPVIGGPPNASLIGNALERGEGVGPGGDRALHMSGMEVMFADGRIVALGGAGFNNQCGALVNTTGLGPDLTGLFVQSNYGIVVQMTFWLQAQPACYQGVAFTLGAEADFPELCAQAQRLAEAGVIKPHSFAIWSIYKFVAAQMQYPYRPDGQPLSNPDEVLEYLPKPLKGARWIGFIGLYSASRWCGLAERQLVRNAVRRYTQRYFVMDPLTDFAVRCGGRWLPKIVGLDLRPIFQAFYRESIFRGVPFEMNLGSAYWRKRNPRPAAMDPDRDRCGLHWLCHVVPFRGEDVARCAEIINAACRRWNFEPNTAYLNNTPHAFRMFFVLTYDRETPGEDARALECIRWLHTALNQAGYQSYRLGLQTMEYATPTDPVLSEVQRGLKTYFDPQGILAPGRYGLG